MPGKNVLMMSVRCGTHSMWVTTSADDIVDNVKSWLVLLYKYVIACKNNRRTWLVSPDTFLKESTGMMTVLIFLEWVVRPGCQAEWSKVCHRELNTGRLYKANLHFLGTMEDSVGREHYTFNRASPWILISAGIFCSIPLWMYGHCASWMLENGGSAWIVVDGVTGKTSHRKRIVLLAVKQENLFISLEQVA